MKVKKTVFIIVIFLLALLLCTPQNADATEKPLFAGGMFFALEPVSMTSSPLNSFLGLGLGGRLYFYVNKHLRLGGMGSVIKRTVGTNEHRFQQGGGGLLVHFAQRFKFFELAGGLFIGGQAIRLEEVQEVTSEGYFTEKRTHTASLLITPQIDFTFWVTKKLQLFILAEYRHPYFAKYLLGHTAQIYLGLHFAH